MVIYSSRFDDLAVETNEECDCLFCFRSPGDFFWHRSETPVLVTLRRWVVPNIGGQLILERCIHGVAEQFQSRIRPEGNRALHNQLLLVVHDDLQALELVAILGPHPAQEGGALIDLKLGCIGAGTTRSARLSENRRDDFTPLDRPYQDGAVEYNVFGK